MFRQYPDNGAFPVPGMVNPNGDTVYPENGMTLYNYFRGQALVGVLANATNRCYPVDDRDIKSMAELASKLAKAMFEVE